MYVHHMHGTLGDQKTESAPLELELETVGNCHGGAGDQTQVLCKSSQHSEPLSRLSSLESYNFLKYVAYKCSLLCPP